MVTSAAGGIIAFTKLVKAIIPVPPAADVTVAPFVCAYVYVCVVCHTRVLC